MSEPKQLFQVPMTPPLKNRNGILGWGCETYARLKGNYDFSKV